MADQQGRADPRPGTAPNLGEEVPNAGPAASPAVAEPSVEFSDVFSLRKPKDAKAGLSSGLKSIGKGIAAGVAGEDLPGHQLLCLEWAGQLGSQSVPALLA